MNQPFCEECHKRKAYFDASTVEERTDGQIDHCFMCEKCFIKLMQFIVDRRGLAFAHKRYAKGIRVFESYLRNPNRRFKGIQSILKEKVIFD